MTCTFICSFSEAQKGAEDKGQIKALLGGLPVAGLVKVQRSCGLVVDILLLKDLRDLISAVMDSALIRPSVLEVR